MALAQKDFKSLRAQNQLGNSLFCSCTFIMWIMSYLCFDQRSGNYGCHEGENSFLLCRDSNSGLADECPNRFTAALRPTAYFSNDPMHPFLRLTAEKISCHSTTSLFFTKGTIQSLITHFHLQSFFR